jgi:hypothetical protein
MNAPGRLMLGRTMQLALLVAGWAYARVTGVSFGAKYASALTALWLVHEAAIRMNPAMLNNPGVDDAGREILMDVDPAVIGGAVAPVAIGAACASALLGMGMTALVASTPSMAKDIAVLIVPAGPMVVGIPLYLILGRLNELADSRRRSAGRA